MSSDKVVEQVYDICIIGGGIGGLATALALANRNWQSRILLCERDLNVADRKQGYGLTLTNSPNGPLARLGILEDCIAKNCVSQSHYTFTAEGDILGYYGRVVRNAIESTTANKAPHVGSCSSSGAGGEGVEQGGNRGNLRIPRQEMRQLMITRLQAKGVRLQWGWKLLDFEESMDEVRVIFDDKNEKQVIKCKVLLGSDGLRSKVRELRDLKYLPISVQSPLNYIGISVMIGISPINHPLLNKKGFYVLDGTHRLFLMPYFNPKENPYEIADLIRNGLQYNHDTAASEAPVEAAALTEETPLIMWQLSFSNMSEQDALSFKASSFEVIYEAARQRVQHMFPAVQELITNTKYTREIWATPLYDREDMFPYRKGDQQKNAYQGRVTLLGDACHPMSMFKGQGANMALEDAVLFAAYMTSGVNQFQEDKKKSAVVQKRKLEDVDTTQTQEDEHQTSTPSSSSSSCPQAPCTSVGLDELSKQSLCTRLRNFEREMIARAGSKVKASREASQRLHSSQALDEKIGISGIPDYPDDILTSVLAKLKEEGVNASLGVELDERFQAVVLSTLQASHE